MVKGMGGAMDLVHGARQVHRDDGARRQGRVAQDRRGVRAAADRQRRASTAIITDLAVVDVTPNGFVLRETAPGVSTDEVREQTGAPLADADDLAEMPVPA